LEEEVQNLGCLNP